MKIRNLTQTLTGTLALLASLLLLTPNAAHAAALTPGNLVVFRAGDGSASLGSTATAAFLVEYTTAGTLVQTIALPTAAAGANQPLTCSGSATSEGFLARSTNGAYISCVGYNAAPGVAGINATASTANPRVVGRVDASGTIDTTTSLSDAFSGSSIRSAVSDNGSSFWLGGNASPVATAGGHYATLGATTSTQLNSTAPTNLRVINIFNGQLYVTSASSPTFGVCTVGTGLPTTSGQTLTLLTGMPTTGTHSPYGFWFADANTLYVADDATVANGGGIQKWTLSGGTWTLAYMVTTTACRGLIGTVVGSTTTLYATTTATSANTLVSVADTGAPIAVTILATAPVNTAFRGVAFGPVPPLALSATAAPAAGPLTRGLANQPVFGFQLTPFQTTAGFSTLALNTSGTATSSDMSNFRVVEAGTPSTSVSGAGLPLAGTINFTIDGTQSSFTATRQYLVIADVAAGATSGTTFTGSIASGGAGTTPAATGSATGNRQTIGIDMTMAAVGSSESATISSLVNDAGPLTSTSGAQVWQVLFNNPASNAGDGTISTLTFTKGAGNTVTNWSTVIQAADLFEGSTHLASGTISADNIAFSGLSVLVADGNSKTLSLRISLKSTPTLNDNTVLQFALTETGVTSSGNNVITPSINSDGTQNKITVTATKLAFTSPNPSTVFFAVINRAFNGTVQAQDANGNLDRDASSGVTVTKASGPGNFTYSGAASLINGQVSWLTSASDGFKFDQTGDYTLTATSDGGLTAATSGTIRVVAAATLADVIMPQYMGGTNSNARLPFAYRVTLGSLSPNSTYWYYNLCVSSADASTVDGAGNYILASQSGSFVQVASGSASFATPGTYGTFTTDGSGNYTGWFVSEETGNARFATLGQPVYMQILLNNGAGGTFILHRVRSTTPVNVLNFGTTADANTGTGIYGNSYATPKNFILLYDNTTGAGRPLAATFVESDGETSSSSYVAFYRSSVDGISGAWGTIIPNVNASGVQRIEERALADGSVVLASTDADGVWPSTANTVNPATGTTPIAITTTDAPLGVHITNIQLSGTDVLIDFAAGASDTISDFTVVSTPDVTTAMVPVAPPAVFSSSAPGVFRATVSGSTAPRFFRIRRP